MYISPMPDVSSWSTDLYSVEKNLLCGFKENKIISFFGRTQAQRQALAKSFTWLNINLSSTSF
jgi:hypothetical protein